MKSSIDKRLNVYHNCNLYRTIERRKESLPRELHDFLDKEARLILIKSLDLYNAAMEYSRAYEIIKAKIRNRTFYTEIARNGGEESLDKNSLMFKAYDACRLTHQDNIIYPKEIYGDRFQATMTLLASRCSIFIDKQVAAKIRLDRDGINPVLKNPLREQENTDSKSVSWGENESLEFSKGKKASEIVALKKKYTKDKNIGSSAPAALDNAK